MASADDAFLLRIEVQEGKGFAHGEVQAVNVHATFGGVARETPYSIAREAHIWGGAEMRWRVTRQQLRELSAT